MLEDNKVIPQVLCKWINNSVKFGAFPECKSYIQPSIQLHAAVLKSTESIPIESKE